MRTTPILLVSLLGLVAAGGSQAALAAPPTVGCATRVEGARATNPVALRRALVIPRVLRLWAGSHGYIAGHGTRTPDGEVYKVPLQVNAAIPQRTLVLAAAEPGVLVHYGGTTASKLRVRACARDHPMWRDGRAIGPWTSFAGGVTVPAPMCVHLVAQAGARTYRLRLGLGVRCS